MKVGLIGAGRVGTHHPSTLATLPASTLRCRMRSPNAHEDLRVAEAGNREENSTVLMEEIT